jgi:hypothetical protein
MYVGVKVPILCVEDGDVLACLLAAAAAAAVVS